MGRRHLPGSLVHDARAYRVKAATAARYIGLAFALGWLACDLRHGGRDGATVWVMAGAVVVFIALKGRER